MKIALVDILCAVGRRCLGVLVLSLLFCLAGFGADIGPITLEIGETMANVGDTAEISVSLTSTTDSPAALILSVQYDPVKVAPFTAFFEFAVRDFITGLVVEDESGNVITRTSAVRLDSAVEALGKGVELDIKASGFIDIVVAGGVGVIPDGPLLTVAFELLPGSVENETVVIDGIDSDVPILYDDVEFFSSAGTIDGEDSRPIPVLFIDGGIVVGCTAAETPVGLVVGETQTDSVELSWDAVTDPNAEYRVFRNDVSLSESALPIGEGWQEETSFSDITAPAPEVTPGAGCLGVPLVTVVPQFYWVKSRTLETGCESEFADASVEGFRGAKKMAVGAVSASAFPASLGGGDGLIMGLVVLLFAFFGGGSAWFGGKAEG